MRQFVIAVLLTAALAVSGQNSPTPNRVRVPDSDTAIAMARRAAVNLYGKKKIADEEPLRAALQDGIWSVAGTLCCSDGKGNRTCEVGMCVGGVVQVRIRQSDGKIISIIHTK